MVINPKCFYLEPEYKKRKEERVRERKEKAKHDIKRHHLYYITSMPSLGSRLGDLSLVGAVLPGAISLALPKEIALDLGLALWICKSAKHMRSHTSSLKGPKVYWNATQNTGTYIMSSISEHRPNKQAEVGQGMVSSHPLLLAAPSSPLFAPDTESLQQFSF